MAGLALGSGAGPRASRTPGVNCGAGAREAPVASGRSARKIEKEHFGHVVPIKMNAECFKSI